MRIQDVVRLMVREYVRAVGHRRARPLLERVDGAWRTTVLMMAADLMDEGLGPAAYVAFVCDGIRRLRGRPPHAGEVFSARSAAGWLPRYRRGGASLAAPGYVASEERRAAHAARVRTAWDRGTTATG
jgi:hypothetical protein